MQESEEVWYDAHACPGVILALGGRIDGVRRWFTRKVVVDALRAHLEAEYGPFEETSRVTAHVAESYCEQTCNGAPHMDLQRYADIMIPLHMIRAQVITVVDTDQ